MFTFNAPQNMLQNKTILITGASDGIGKCCAETFANYGANLILLGRSQGKLEKLYDAIDRAHPNKITIHPMNFETASEHDYKILGESLDSQFPCLDGFIHSAGKLGDRSPIEFYSFETWNKTMQVNLSSTFLLTKVLLQSLSKSSDARIILTSSSVGRKGKANWGAYAVSKFAIEGLMQTLADELKNTSNIRINSVNPGGIKTAMRRAAYPAENPNAQPEPKVLMPFYLYLFSKGTETIHGEALNFRDFDEQIFTENSNKV
ncbi:MAG: YciK family oxidoreductase [Gammaproteobacteria bacterium]|nr:YciK family oxidoreductase [Gammaproteobacteria bacterium]